MKSKLSLSIFLQALPQMTCAAGTTMPDLGLAGTIFVLAAYAGYYLVVFILIPAVCTYVAYRLIKSTRLQDALLSLLKSRYMYSVAAVLLWVILVYLKTDGFSEGKLDGARDWGLFAGTIAAWFVIPQIVVGVFLRKKNLLTPCQNSWLPLWSFLLPAVLCIPVLQRNRWKAPG